MMSYLIRKKQKQGCNKMEEIHTQKKRKKLLYRVLTILFSLLLIYFCLLYLNSWIHEDYPGYSGSIEIAKSLGVFVDEYSADKQILISGDAFKIDIGDIWTERKFRKGKLFDYPHIDSISDKRDNYELCLRLNSDAKLINSLLFFTYSVYILSGDSVDTGGIKGSGDDVWFRFSMMDANHDKFYIFVIKNDNLGQEKIDPKFLEEYAETKITLTRISGK